MLDVVDSTASSRTLVSSRIAGIVPGSDEVQLALMTGAFESLRLLDVSNAAVGEFVPLQH